jgi:hypothetical protein
MIELGIKKTCGSEFGSSSEMGNLLIYEYKYLIRVISKKEGDGGDSVSLIYSLLRVGSDRNS